MTIITRILNETEKTYGQKTTLIDSDPIGTVTIREKEFDSFEQIGEFIKEENIVCEMSTSTLNEYEYDLVIK